MNEDNKLTISDYFDDNNVLFNIQRCITSQCVAFFTIILDFFSYIKEWVMNVFNAYSFTNLFQRNYSHDNITNLDKNDGYLDIEDSSQLYYQESEFLLSQN